MKAPLGIMVCGNLKGRRFSKYWMLDCAAAVQNMLLAAHTLGLGAVWTGIFPDDARMDGFAKLLGLPDQIIPHTLVVIGYPIELPPKQNRFKPD